MEPDDEHGVVMKFQKSDSIPKEAKVLTEFEAKAYMFDIILKWKPRREV